MVVICLKDNVVIWLYSLHNKSDNYLKGIVNGLVVICKTFTLSFVRHQYFNCTICMHVSLNSALKGFKDIQGSKSKAIAKCIAAKVSHLKNC